MTTVCIIDDDEAVRSSTGVLLKMSGYDVESYETTQDFLTAHPEPDEAFIVLDQHLPQQTGLEFLESTQGRCFSARAVLVTGRGNSQLKERALRDGVAGYLEKPVDVGALVEIFANLA